MSRMTLEGYTYYVPEAYPECDLEGWAYEYWISLDTEGQIAYFSSMSMGDEYPLTEGQCDLALEQARTRVGKGFMPDNVEMI